MNKIQLLTFALNRSCFFFFVFLHVLLLKKIFFCAHINHFTLCPRTDVTCDEQPRSYLTAIKLLFQYDDAACWSKWNKIIQHLHYFLIFLTKFQISLTSHFFTVKNHRRNNSSRSTTMFTLEKLFHSIDWEWKVKGWTIVILNDNLSYLCTQWQTNFT